MPEALPALANEKSARSGIDVRVEVVSWEALPREREVEQNVRSSWAARQTQQDRIALLQKQVEANQQTDEGYVQQFDIGQRGLLDVLDAANELFISNDQLIQAENEELFANFRILAS